MPELFNIECPHCYENVEIPDHCEFHDAGYEFWEIKEQCPECYNTIVLTEDCL